MLPLCPICQKQYSNTVRPMLQHPCGHGICESCQIMSDERHLTTCSICRGLVTVVTPNYDLRGMCKDDEVPWKQKLIDSMEFLAEDCEEIVIDDCLENVAPLIVLKAKNVQGMRQFRQVMSVLVQTMSTSDIFDWISVLRFDNERELIMMTSKMIDDKLFLDTQKALWVFRMVH